MVTPLEQESIIVICKIDGIYSPDRSGGLLFTMTPREEVSQMSMAVWVISHNIHGCWYTS